MEFYLVDWDTKFGLIKGGNLKYQLLQDDLFTIKILKFLNVAWNIATGFSTIFNKSYEIFVRIFLYIRNVQNYICIDLVMNRNNLRMEC